VALRRSGDGLYYVHPDHLGSVMLTTDTSDPGETVAEQRFYPWGQATRYPDGGTQKTEYNFTGQRLDDSTDLLYYGARYYDPALRRFVSPDAIVPNPGNAQSLNRYSYVYNNPLRYTDPTGHAADPGGAWARGNKPWTPPAPTLPTGGTSGPSTQTEPTSLWDPISSLSNGQVFVTEYQDGQLVIILLDTGQIQVALVPRGQETTSSQALSVLGLTADVVDFSLTASFGGAYTLEQLLTASAGPPGAGAGLVAGEVAYRMVQPGLLLFVDLPGWATVFWADVAAGRTSVDLARSELSVGLDTLANSASLAISNAPLPVVPGVYTSSMGDAGQLAYDFLRFSGRLPGYSVVVRWRGAR